MVFLSVLIAYDDSRNSPYECFYIINFWWLYDCCYSDCLAYLVSSDITFNWRRVVQLPLLYITGPSSLVVSIIKMQLALMNHRIPQCTSIHEICRYIFPMGMASSSLSVCWLIKISFCFQLQLHPWLILTTSPPSHPRFTSRMPHVGRTTRRPRVRGPREWAHLFGMCTLYFIKPRGVERWTSQARLADDALLHLAYCNLGIFVK